MEMTRIAALDLRSPDVIEEQRQAADGLAQLAALDKMWDWPSVPLFIARRHIEVKITADTTEFMRVLREAAQNYIFNFGFNPAHERQHALMAIQQMHYAHTLGETVQGGVLFWTPRTRWNLYDNWPVYCLAVGLALLVGLIVGSWPWQ